jgi:hypothetical protein
MRLAPPLLALLGLAASCNFDAAFKRYCEKNSQCLADAGSGPETGSASDAADAVVAVDAVDAVVAVDAVDAENSPRIPPPRTCGPSGECQNPKEVCHPFGQVCMMTCDTSADCPPWLDNCVAIRDSSGGPRTPKVCTCTSAQICNSYANSYTTVFTCNPSDNLCERLCSSAQDYCAMFEPPRVCDQTSGRCQSSTSPCSSNTDCPSASQPRCDPVNQRCTGCISPADCAGRPDGFTQCGPTGSCVGP